MMATVLGDRAELDFFLVLLSPRPVRLVVLAPGIAECKHRNETRDTGERFDFEGYERLQNDMSREFSDSGWWFDTSGITPAETAERVVTEAVGRTEPLAAGGHAWLRRLHNV
jgi:hypothetical protein